MGGIALTQRLSDARKKAQRRAINDIDFHDFLELSNRGLTDTEIASELGIDKRYISMLREDIQRDY